MFRAYFDMATAEISEFSEVYSAYAAGCLDPGFALMVETQAVLRPEVQRALIKAEAIAGIMLEKEVEKPLSDSVFVATMSLIDAEESNPSQLQTAVRTASAELDEILLLPSPLRETVLETALQNDWQTLTPGVRRMKLSVDSEAEVELYRIAPLSTVPRHTHSGSEFTLVVAGGFHDETGQYGPGDLCLKGPENTHQPTADAEGVCYALSLREGGLRFTGMMGLLQRVLGQ